MSGLLAIIPARAGSKGVPGKNKALIGEKPLIEYTVAAATAAKAVSGILLTTDDRAILEYYKNREGVLVVTRPTELAQDDSTTSDVVAHAIDAWVSSGRQLPKSLLLAQPTTPLRTAADIDGAFTLFERVGEKPVVSACKVDGIRHPRVMYRMDSEAVASALYIQDADEKFQRQTYEPLYQRNGAIYLVTLEYFRRTGRLQSESPVIYEMPWERSINIDVPGDLLIAKALLESGLLGPTLGLR